MIKNATIFSLESPLNPEALRSALAAQAFCPIGSLESSTCGFVAPVSEGDLVFTSGEFSACALRIDKKTIPGSAVKQKTHERAQEIETRQGFKPGRKQMKEIKERVINSLLPLAIPSTKIVNFYLLGTAYLVIDTTSAAVADQVMGLLAKVLNPFPLSLWSLKQSPASCMTGWLALDEAPTGFSIDQMAQMKAAGESRASVTWKNENIDCQQAAEHAARGKQVIKMAMTHLDQVSFALDEHAKISAIKLLGLKDQDTQSAADELQTKEADLFLYGSRIKALIQALEVAMSED